MPNLRPEQITYLKDVLHNATFTLLSPAENAMARKAYNNARRGLMKQLGRKVNDGYVLHHIIQTSTNGSPTDRLNLVKLSASEHRKIHGKGSPLNQIMYNKL